MHIEKGFYRKFALLLILTVPTLYFPFSFFLMELLDVLIPRERLFDTLFTLPRVLMFRAFPLSLIYVILGPVVAFFLSFFVSRKRERDCPERVARWLSLTSLAALLLGAGFWVFFFLGW